MKKCSKCGFPKDESEFKKDSQKKDGLNSSCKSCNKSRSAEYRARPEVQERQKVLYTTNHEQRRKTWREWYVERKDDQNKTKRKRNLLLKEEVLSHYGGVCQCCGEDQIAFLSIDHINGGGNKHRKSIGGLSGVNFYRWLKSNKYPDGYQTLCHNCNQAKGFFGMCPHQFEKDALAQ